MNLDLKVWLVVQGKGVKGELLTDKVEGALTQQQKKTEEENQEEAGGISSQSLLLLIVTCLVVPMCDDVAMCAAGLGSPPPDGDAASPTRRTLTPCDGQQHQSTASPPEVKHEEHVDESNAPSAAFPGDQSPPSPGDPPPPCGDGSPAERQQDLGVLCQTSTPM